MPASDQKHSGNLKSPTEKTQSPLYNDQQGKIFRVCKIAKLIRYLHQDNIWVYSF